ncbi:MAG: hypothetical protein GEU75_09050 [Dehalococcoidia bacterium]|nr:hypothetical protein [Dehalococcoidia bacterium]
MRSSVEHNEPTGFETVYQGETVVLTPRRRPRWRRWLQSVGAAIECVGYLDADARGLDPLDAWTGERYVPPAPKRIKPDQSKEEE